MADPYLVLDSVRPPNMAYQEAVDFDEIVGQPFEVRSDSDREVVLCALQMNAEV